VVFHVSDPFAVEPKWDFVFTMERVTAPANGGGGLSNSGDEGEMEMVADICGGGGGEELLGLSV